MTQKRQYRPPFIPDGWSWGIGLVVGLLVFLYTDLTGSLPFWAAAAVALLVLLAVGIGIDLWDAKAYYYKRAYDQMDKAEALLRQITDTARDIHDKEAGRVLASICRKVQRLFDPREGKVTPDGVGDQFLSTATAFVIALTTVADSASKFVSLEESFSLDEQGRQTLKDALAQFTTIDEWLNNADKQLHSGDRVGLEALTNQMKTYRFRAL